MRIDSKTGLPSKIALRYYIRTVRNAIGSGLAQKKSIACVSRILAHEEYKKAKVILAYSAHGGELDVSSLCESAIAQNKVIAYPICDGQGGMIAAIPFQNQWETDKYGIVEPKLNKSRLIMPYEIDLIVVPGVAFSDTGARVGWGAGYYDKYLKICAKAYRMGVCFCEQIQNDIISDEWDVHMQSIITDKKVYDI